MQRDDISRGRWRRAKKCISSPLPGSPPTIAAPTQSLWQTAAIGLRCLIDCDWTLRRAGAVSTITGVTW
jgi:hypothetical protein